MKTIVLLILITLSAGCKKSIEKVQEDLIIRAMTDGQWAITRFTINGTDNTSDFATYKFQYYSNKTVDAIKNNVAEFTGTWDGNASTSTTSASFPSASLPISYINGSWKIDRNSWTYVEATQVSGGVTKVMRLDKL